MSRFGNCPPHPAARQPAAETGSEAGRIGSREQCGPAIEWPTSCDETPSDQAGDSVTIFRLF